MKYCRVIVRLPLSSFSLNVHIETTFYTAQIRQQFKGNKAWILLELRTHVICLFDVPNLKQNYPWESYLHAVQIFKAV